LLVVVEVVELLEVAVVLVVIKHPCLRLLVDLVDLQRHN
jgi:hypothetical protein